MKADAEAGEKLDGVIDRQRPQDTADDGRTPAVEVGFGDDGVRDVAAGSTADENLGAGLPRAFEQCHADVGIPAPREDGGREAGRARPDDDDVEDVGAARLARSRAAS